MFIGLAGFSAARRASSWRRAVADAVRTFAFPPGASLQTRHALPIPRARPSLLSSACSTAGVLLLVLAAVLPERWYPVAALFVGIALLAVSHALTPCEERIDKLRKMRASMRHQL